VEVDHAALLLRPVVIDDADDAAALATDLDDRSARQARLRLAVVVEGRTAGQRVLRLPGEGGRAGSLAHRLGADARLGGLRTGHDDADLDRRGLDDRGGRVQTGGRDVGIVKGGLGRVRRSGVVRWDVELLERASRDSLERAGNPRAGGYRQDDQGE